MVSSLSRRYSSAGPATSGQCGAGLPDPGDDAAHRARLDSSGWGRVTSVTTALSALNFRLALHDLVIPRSHPAAPNRFMLAACATTSKSRASRSRISR